MSEQQLPIRKTRSQNGPENVVFGAVGVGGKAIRKTVVLRMALLTNSKHGLFMNPFKFPVDMRPGGWRNWQVRWVPLAVWVTILNLVIYTLIIIFGNSSN